MLADQGNDRKPTIRKDGLNFRGMEDRSGEADRESYCQRGKKYRRNLRLEKRKNGSISGMN